MNRLISVVIPCYKSSVTIESVVRQTLREIAQIGDRAEFVLINDCSPDTTSDAICSLISEGLPVYTADLSRNFGQHSAIMAGLKHANGDIILLMDDDMQTHPTQVPKLLSGLDDPMIDVVFGRYQKRREAAWRRAGSAFARWTLRMMVGIPKGLVPSSFVAMRRKVAETILDYTGPYPYITGLIFQATSHVGEIQVEHYDRASGSSGYTLKSLVKLWMTIINFSMAPLRLASALGAIMGTIGLIAATFLVVRKLMFPDTTVGWSSIMVSILVCAGLTIMFLGITGEYVGRILMNTNHVPQYVIRNSIEGRDIADEAK